MRPRTVREIQARSRSICATERGGDAELAGNTAGVNVVFRERRARSTGAIHALMFWARVRDWHAQDRRNCQ